jgi:hypothetical protein
MKKFKSIALGIVVIGFAVALAIIFGVLYIHKGNQVSIKSQNITAIDKNINLKSTTVEYNSTSYRVFVFTDSTGKILNITVK